ncbi:MAG: hypothetical protein IKT37_00635 [Clostridia bacterium]|nr:hypothetical protein [Clostridia bacterium]
MKKFSIALVVLVLVLSLSACLKSADAQNAEALIVAIGDVTLESESSIVAAENAVNALNNFEKAQVENLATLHNARQLYDDLVAKNKAEEERIATVKEAAAKIDAAIKAIGTVTLESGAKISAARNAYDAADKETREYVTALSTLKSAEATLSQLQADIVIELIDAIGKVTLNSGDSIKAAQQAYDSLSHDATSKVHNADLLRAAIVELNNLQKAEGKRLLNSMNANRDEVRSITFYYHKNFPYSSRGYWITDERSFVLPYIGMNDNNIWLRIVCNYTGSNWLFFEKITYHIDGENSYEFFDYFDVTRDNDSGDVWEYVDRLAEESEIELLWAIANSEKTIIRFEGDNKYRDFTVSEKDKEAIRQTLTAYEILKNK